MPRVRPPALTPRTLLRATAQRRDTHRPNTVTPLRQPSGRAAEQRSQPSEPSEPAHGEPGPPCPSCGISRGVPSTCSAQHTGESRHVSPGQLPCQPVRVPGT